jgi:hypothetical protein
MTDANAAINAAEINSYLQSKGWQADGEWRGARVWRLGTQVRLLIPLEPSYEDAADLIEQAIAKIARYEERPERDVRLDIIEPMTDTQYFRTHPNAPAGSISLANGLKVVQSIHNLVKTAAVTVQQGPELLYEGRSSAQVQAFLHKVLLSSAAPGSYVLTARIPAQSDIAVLPGRSVSAQLHGAVNAARTAAQRVIDGQHSIETFYESVSSGVSANLCRALGNLGGEGRNQQFEIGFSWARGMRAEEVARPAEVAFTARMPQVLAAAGDELMAMARAGTAHIIGRVSELQEQPGRRYRVQIRGDLGMGKDTRLRRRSIWVVVDGEQHDIAIGAYRRHESVEVTGRLSTDRGSLELLAATLRIIR